MGEVTEIQCQYIKFRKKYRAERIPKNPIKGTVYFLGTEQRPNHDPHHMLAQLEDRIDDLYVITSPMSKIIKKISFRKNHKSNKLVCFNCLSLL